MKPLEIVILLVKSILNPLVKLAAEGLIKLVKLTEAKEDDEFLIKLAEEILRERGKLKDPDIE